MKDYAGILFIVIGVAVFTGSIASQCASPPDILELACQPLGDGRLICEVL